ncbi:MAG TPA: DUF493 family protein [Brumimicrobium sp.]|nr:DUF493 family protein [Brumimicrobium sp.]
MGEFDKLKEQLELEEWPNLYLFKFIMPSENEKIAKITKLFNEDSDMTIRPSRNGNFTSISVKEVMINSESVIEVYEKASLVKGVIIL